LKDPPDFKLMSVWRLARCRPKRITDDLSARVLCRECDQENVDDGHRRELTLLQQNQTVQCGVSCDGDRVGG
jgi:hypothetical protein